MESGAAGLEPVKQGDRGRQGNFCRPALKTVLVQFLDMSALLLEAQRRSSENFVNILNILSDDYFSEIHNVRFVVHCLKVVLIENKSMAQHDDITSIN